MMGQHFLDVVGTVMDELQVLELAPVLAVGRMIPTLSSDSSHSP